MNTTLNFSPLDQAIHRIVSHQYETGTESLWSNVRLTDLVCFFGGLLLPIAGFAAGKWL